LTELTNAVGARQTAGDLCHVLLRGGGLLRDLADAVVDAPEHVYVGGDLNVEPHRPGTRL
jgi:hypothetical protein